MKFVYPVDPKNGNEKIPAYLKGASNLTGYYPIGRMNTWHGGIHYEGDNPIKSIADGKIIAYRVPKEYHKEIVDNKTSKYSNGFVLIEHSYKSPNEQEMTFYSLYNHLSSFKEMEKKKFPKFLTIESYTVKEDANDTIKVKGVPIKSSSSGGSTLAHAAKGTVLSFEEEANSNDRRKVKYTTPQGNEIIGYVYIKKHSKNGQLVNAETGEVLTEYYEGSNGDKGANLREEAKGDADVEQLLLRGTSLEIAESDLGKTGWLKVKKAGGKKVSGYCHTEGLSIVDVVTLKDDDDLNKVIKDQCYEVKAGDIIGFAGLNGFEKKEEYRGCHVEVFTADEVSDFLSNAKGDGEKNKNFAKLTEGTELKKKLPLKVIKNLPVKKTGKTSDGYTEVEVDNLEVVVKSRSTDLPQDYKKATELYSFKSEGSNATANQSALTEFNKLVGDIAQMDDDVKLITNYNEGNQSSSNRKVEYQTPNKGQTFWVKNEDLEEKTLTFSIETTTTAPANANGQAAPPPATPAVANGAAQTRDGAAQAAVAEPPAQPTNAQPTAVTTATTETKKYFRLNKELTEVYIIDPKDDNVNIKIEADVIVNTKGGKTFTDKDEKEWYLLEPIGMQKDGVAIKYKGLICEDDLCEKFSAYNWSKFGFEVKEDTDNHYIYDFENKSSFFADICNIVDQDGDGILEPYELQRALNNHYTADKLSHLVCKHHNEWAYSGKYLSPLIEELEKFYTKALEKDADDKELENQAELDAIKEERKQAFEAKVNQLALWEGIEARESSYRTKWVNGTLMTSAVAMGTYLTYRYGKWLYEKVAYGDEPEKEIPLSPFPIDKPVVYHFHPVAFVEQMKKLGNFIKLTEELIIAIITTVSKFEGDFSSCNKDTEFSGGISGLSYTGVVHIGLSWGYLQFTQDGGSLGKVLKRMNEKNNSKFKAIFDSNSEELLSVTGKSGTSGLSTWRGLSKSKKDEYKENNTEIRSDRVQKIAVKKNSSELKDLWEEPWVGRFKNAGKVEDFKNAQREIGREVYWGSSLKICKEFKICTDRGLAIVFDRTVNQGAGGCKSLVKKIFKTKEDRSAEEELNLLYEVRDNWDESHFIYDRIDKILKTNDFDNQQYIF